MRLFLVLGLLCALVQPASAQFKGATLQVLDQNGMKAVRPKVKSIRAEPSTITIKVGQEFSLDAITVVVTDSSGKDLGRIREFDFGIPRLAAAEAVPRKVTGKKVGTADLTIRFPRHLWTPRTDTRPFTVVKVIVKQ